MDKVLYAIAILLVVLIIYNQWFRPEYLTDDEIAQSIVAAAMVRDPQDSTAIIKQMSPAEQRRYERFDGLPYDPRFYKERFESGSGQLPYNPRFYKEHMSPEFVQSLYA